MEIGHCFLDGNVDAVEFCTHKSFTNVLAASTYVLQDGDCPTRSGGVTLFDVDVDAGELRLIQKLETSGIFDLKWNPEVGQDLRPPLLSQADADGYVKLYSFQGYSPDDPKMPGNYVKEECSKSISSSMCLCIDWNPSATMVSVGLSDGSVSVISLNESQLCVLHEWKSHEYEVWAATFDLHQPMLVYSGSDDCKFTCWDLRTSKPAFHNTKSHKMGICSISRCLEDTNTLLTGSYDEHLRIWDVRLPSNPINESAICLGGGVWKIKHHPYAAGIVLAACMHNGFAVVDISGDEARVVERYDKHESLAYGADWQRADLLVGDGRKTTAIATCSFYDRLVRVWTPQADIFV